MDRPTLGEWLREGPFGLTMSSGFFGFYAHLGMLSVLEDEGFTPSRISGSSAGALVGGAWAAGVSSASLATTILALKRESFWDPGIGPGLLAGRLFRGLLDELLPVRTFEECRLPVAVSIFGLASRRVEVVESGLLAPALHASCAVPFMFHPVWIARRPYVDGGVADRPGLAGMPQTSRVLFHHLVSRSPWRRRGGRSMMVPRRSNMKTLMIEGLPRVDPFHLDLGARAFDVARERTRTALSKPADDAIHA